MPIRVVYFSVIPLATATNGGNISCRNNITRLSKDPNIQLFVISAPLHHDIELTRLFLENLKIDYRIVPRLPVKFQQEEMTLRSAANFALKAATYFPWELEALNQPQFDTVLSEVITDWPAEIVVIDYLYSALFCPKTLSGPTKTAIITQNRETQFHRDMIRLGLIKHDPFTAELSARRLERFERSAYRSADMLIALNIKDLPPYIPANKKTCVVPYLDPTDPWKYSETGSVFFVGNIAHFPNFEAVGFIATKLAPLVESRAPDLRFSIVGATADDVPADWRHPQIDYLGVSDAETVKQLFITGKAMLAPISNTYGVKYKMLEAVAHGTPMISSAEASECLPYISGLPTFPFGDATAAADLVVRLTKEPASLERMSKTITADGRAFAMSQTTRWSAVLSDI